MSSWPDCDYASCSYLSGSCGACFAVLVGRPIDAFEIHAYSVISCILCTFMHTQHGNKYDKGSV